MKTTTAGMLDVLKHINMHVTALPDSKNPKILIDWDVCDYPEDSFVRKSVMETYTLAAIIKNLSFTDLFGAGLVVSGFQPKLRIYKLLISARNQQFFSRKVKNS